ncbi:hypothetical protein PHYNN_67 [Pantoea phage Phynn]|nr:hypothetical protein PHYNN_67 [Pantoea phage Phynn]
MSVKILDEVQKTAILTAYTDQSVSMRALAKQFGVSARTIGRVIDQFIKTATADKKKATKKPKPTSTEPKMIGSESFITVLAADGQVYTVDSSHPKFLDAFDLVKQGGTENIEKVISLINTGRFITNYSKGQIKIIGNQVLYGGLVFDTSVTKRIISEMHNGRPYEHLVNFFEKLMQNPSRDAVYQLYGFLVHNDIEICEDGDIIAWKRVNQNYRDFATGTFDNSPGLVVEMPRNQVDENKHRTCSAGLHAAAASYIPSYHGGSGRILKMKINPADVVAIPTDYDNAKMRVCRYLSMGDATTEFISKYNY